MTVERYKNEDGKVGVVYADGFGAGWSSWNEEEHREFLIFDKKIVQLVLDDKREELDDYVYEKLGEEATLLCDSLAIEWVDEGELVYIREYGGSETVILCQKKAYTA